MSVGRHVFAALVAAFFGPVAGLFAFLVASFFAGPGWIMFWLFVALGVAGMYAAMLAKLRESG